MIRIQTWSGVVSSASPYILPVGGAVEQVNCMSLVPGQLSVRGGIATTEGFVLVGPVGGDEIWGYTNGSYVTPFVFSSSTPTVFSQGRHGEVYEYNGAVPGRVWSPSSKAWRKTGLAAPATQPTVTLTTPATYYIARVDIESAGSGYVKPPVITIASPGSVFGMVQATAVSRITGGYVSNISVTNSGKGYLATPTVAATDFGACGTELAATVELEEGFATGDYKTGIVYWEVVKDGVGYPCWTAAYATTPAGPKFARVIPKDVSPGTGAKVRVSFGPTVTDPCISTTTPGNYSYFVEVEAMGQGYTKGSSITLAVDFGPAYSSLYGAQNCNSACGMVMRGYTIDHPNCPPASDLGGLNPFRARKIKKLNVTDGKAGTLYLKAPSCKILPFTGAPSSTAKEFPSTVLNGAVQTIDVPDEEKYLFPPVLDATNSGKAKALAVVRATLRGKYQCYYRFVNNAVPEAEGGPLYSSLSPVKEVDAGDGAAKLTWAVTGSSYELWRTSSNQATTLFRVAKVGGGTTKDPAFGSLIDTLTDWELTDPDRTGFMAMPILLPNGELNANRFGVPPIDYQVAVMFQDRLWMGVKPGGSDFNTLRFSEADEPESMPDVNELIIQSNLRSTDYITALIPYAGAMVVCQSRHSHRMTYVSQPLIDAAFFLLAYRGCINQRCWDIYDGRVYAMDDQGVYSLDPQGNVESLTLGIDDVWRGSIDMNLSSRFLVRADRRLNVLRVSLAFKGDGSSKYPTRQLVYSFDYKTWWEERYPIEFRGATETRTSTGEIALVYSTSDAIYRVATGLQDVAEDTIAAVSIGSKGYGYKIPPVITASGGHGAVFECGINQDGEITGINVKLSGTGYTDGGLTIGPPGDGGTQATASYSTASGVYPVSWSFRSAAFEYVNDSQKKNGGEQQTRHCSVTYQPTANSTLLQLKAYYNNAKYPRSNVVRRDRGTGFVHSDTMPASELDMQATPLQDAEAHGVARTLFAGRVLDDMMGSDRHVSIELSGKQTDAGAVAIHSIDIFGVNDKSAGD